MQVSMLILLLCALWMSIQAEPSDNSTCPSVFNADISVGGQHCCEYTDQQFKLEYGYGDVKLTSLLEKLRAWNCSEYNYQCEHRVYDFDQFSGLVYDKFCNKTAFDEKCQTEIVSSEKLPAQEFAAFAARSPCLQISSYRYGKMYVEVAQFNLPFCPVVWCGFDELAMRIYGDTSWNCYPKICQINIIILMLVCGTLAIAIIIANITVISVVLGSPKFSSGQMKYKLSLAVADLLVGIIVFPSFVVNLYLGEVFSFGPEHYNMSATESNDLFSLSSNETAVGNEEDVSIRSHYPNEYLDVVGFFTSLSLVVSIYTLMFASFDRYNAVRSPLSYNGDVAVKLARKIILGVWLFAVVFSLLPIWVPYVKPYNIKIAGLIVLIDNFDAGIFMYGIALVLPFVAVCLFTLLTWCASRKQGHRRRKMVSQKERKKLRIERRLANTLGLMIGVFTASMLPAIATNVVPEIVPGLDLAEPETLHLQSYAIYNGCEIVACIILMCNSLWNCFIYSLRNRDFREQARRQRRALAARMGLRYLSKRIGRCVGFTMTDEQRRSSYPPSVSTTSKRFFSLSSADGTTSSRPSNYNSQLV